MQPEGRLATAGAPVFGPRGVLKYPAHRQALHMSALFALVSEGGDRDVEWLRHKNHVAVANLLVRCLTSATACQMMT